MNEVKRLMSQVEQKKRGFQFSIRELAITMAMIAFAVGWLMEYRKVHSLLKEIERLRTEQAARGFKLSVHGESSKTRLWYVDEIINKRSTLDVLRRLELGDE